MFGNQYNISDLKPIISIYQFRGVLYLWGTYGIFLTMFGMFMVQNQQNNPLPRLDYTNFRPILADIVVNIDIPIFIFGAFENRYCNFLQNQCDILVYCTALIFFLKELA